ncbi:MAG TPA: mechanosensitive ion channel domain-containing protein, partial [Gemmatimonadaceae bacterium]
MILDVLATIAASEPPQLFGIHLIGITPENGRKLLLSIALVVIVTLVLSLARKAFHRLTHSYEHLAFWTQQATRILAFVVLVLGLISIWVNDPGSLATGAGLLTAGVAIALQRVITAFAGYLIILRGKSFTVGDRITIGGVRGDVVALGFMQTTVLEMGEAPGEQSAPPAQWVTARQYTGRIVRVTNDKIFDSPVYNYTREFPYMWEELRIPVGYKSDRNRAEQILLDVGRRQTAQTVDEARAAMESLHKKYTIPGSTDTEPHVYYHLTDNWIELTLRFVAPVRGVRPLKDAMSR